MLRKRRAHGPLAWLLLAWGFIRTVKLVLSALIVGFTHRRSRMRERMSPRQRFELYADIEMQRERNRHVHEHASMR